MLFLLACTAPDPADDTDTDADTDTDTDTTDTDTDLEFGLSLPAATSSAGNALEAECAWELSVEYECQNDSPALTWVGTPTGTVAFALVFDDPDAGDFDHWALVNIPGDLMGLDAGISGSTAAGVLPDGAYELENGFGFDGYLGSCPPSPHVYRWRLWALFEPLDSDLSRFSQVINQAEDRALGLAETCHIYGPSSG